MQPAGLDASEVVVGPGEQHVATMARLQRDNRYDRTADGVERVTGIPPQSIEAFVAARRDFYLGLDRRGGSGRPG
jgi:hypothetical protein